MLWVSNPLERGDGGVLLKSTGGERGGPRTAALLTHPTPHPPVNSSVVSGTQRLFSGSQSTAAQETALLRAPKSLHDFLIGGLGLGVRWWESGPHCQSATPRRDQIPPLCWDARPVKAVRHGGSGWVASKGELAGAGRKVDGSHEGMFAKGAGERIYMKLLREGIALHRNSNF